MAEPAKSLVSKSAPNSSNLATNTRTPHKVRGNLCMSAILLIRQLSASFLRPTHGFKRIPMPMWSSRVTAVVTNIITPPKIQ